MKMVRVTLIDGTKKEMTKDEFMVISLEGMMKAMDGKPIVNFEHYEESGK